MAIGSWRSGIPQRRRRRKAPPPPPASHPVFTGFTEEKASAFEASEVNMRESVRETAVYIADPSRAEAVTSAMDAQTAARKASGQVAKVK